MNCTIEPATDEDLADTSPSGRHDCRGELGDGAVKAIPLDTLEEPSSGSSIEEPLDG